MRLSLIHIFITRLTEADINELLPYHQFGDAKETDNGGFNVIYSRYEPSAAVPNVVSIPAADVPAITLNTSGNRTVTLCSAHPKSPMRGCADWSAGILGLRELARAKSVSNRNIVVVMGDLNSVSYTHLAVYKRQVKDVFSRDCCPASHPSVTSFGPHL